MLEALLNSEVYSDHFDVFGDAGGSSTIGSIVNELPNSLILGKMESLDAILGLKNTFERVEEESLYSLDAYYNDLVRLTVETLFDSSSASLGSTLAPQILNDPIFTATNPPSSTPSSPSPQFSKITSTKPSVGTYSMPSSSSSSTLSSLREKEREREREKQQLALLQQKLREAQLKLEAEVKLRNQKESNLEAAYERLSKNMKLVEEKSRECEAMMRKQMKEIEQTIQREKKREKEKKGSPFDRSKSDAERRLSDLEEKLRSLGDQSNQVRTTSAYAKQRLQQEHYVTSTPELHLFSRTFQMKLSDLFLACKSLASGKIVQEDSRKLQATETLISWTTQSVPVPGVEVAASLLTRCAKEWHNRFRDKRHERMSEIAQNVTAFEAMSGELALLLAIKYEDQIVLLKPKGVVTFAKVGCQKFACSCHSRH